MNVIACHSGGPSLRTLGDTTKKTPDFIRHRRHFGSGDCIAIGKKNLCKPTRFMSLCSIVLKKGSFITGKGLYRDPTCELHPNFSWACQLHNPLSQRTWPNPTRQQKNLNGDAENLPHLWERENGVDVRASEEEEEESSSTFTKTGVEQKSLQTREGKQNPRTGLGAASDTGLAASFRDGKSQSTKTLFQFQMRCPRSRE